VGGRHSSAVRRHARTIAGTTQRRTKGFSNQAVQRGHGSVAARPEDPALKEDVMPRAGSKKTPMWEWVLLFILIIVIIVFIVLWATGTFQA